MASFYSGYDSRGYRFRLDVSETSTSTSGNYSSLSWALYVETTRDYYFQTNNNTVKVNVDGSVYDSKTSINMSSATTTLICSGTKTIYHNSDGSKSINVSASFTPSSTAYYMPLSASLGGTMSLSNIPRQANIKSAPDFNDEENPTITYSNPAGNSVSELKIGIFNTAGTVEYVPYRDVSKTESSYTFNLTSSERQALRQACTSNSLQVKFYLRTLIDGSHYYSSMQKTMTLVNANPTFNDFEYKDTNSTTVNLTGDNQKIVLGYSNVEITIPTSMKATANKEANMVKYRFGDKESNYSSSSVVTIPTVSNINTSTLSVYAIDSRGNSTRKDKFPTTISYVSLTKGNINVSRQNGVSEIVTLSLDGKLNILDFGNVTNSITYSKYRYRKSDSINWSEYNDITLTVDSSGNFSFEDTIAGDTQTLGFDINDSYVIEVLIKDELSQITYSSNLASGIPHVAYAKNGIGIMGEYDNSVGGALQIGGIPIIKSGSNSNGSWIKFADGTMICTKTISGSVDVTIRWGVLYESIAINLGDFPEEFIEIPKIYITSRDIGAIIEGCFYPTTQSYGKTYIALPSTYNSRNYTLDIMAIGRWK